MVSNQFRPDYERAQRVGIEEAVFCSGKTAAQITSIVLDSQAREHDLLLTRLTATRYAELESDVQSRIDYDSMSNTGIVGDRVQAPDEHSVAVVTAGTSDLPVAKECQRTLLFHSVGSTPFYDVGVAGLWRILGVEPELRSFPVVIVVAGMDAALASVVGGLIRSVIIAVPTSVGYGVAQGGRSALESILSSCAPGVTTVNIDNGYGAACAAIRVLNSQQSKTDHGQ